MHSSEGGNRRARPLSLDALAMQAVLRRRSHGPLRCAALGAGCSHIAMLFLHNTRQRGCKRPAHVE